MTAIVGSSGAGKSTLVDLLLGLDRPGAGRICIDGVDLGEYDLASYRSRVGFVPQTSLLFHDSIRENLRWVKADASDQEIRRAATLARAAEFIEELPEGYDTVVGDRGVRLSGGQVQRVALARALLRRPELLVLDEATSALDSASERAIQEALERVSPETTLVVVAHRLSTIVAADRIYVLEAGRVVEEGSYGELVARQGSFARMVALQQLDGHGA
jgi:ABC-type multidrug transport system fused ATPase/permease subunit